MKCCICGKNFVGFGNNALPYKKGLCCDKCNNEKIIPLRLFAINNKDVKILDVWETDYDDIRCNAILYEKGVEVANVIASYEDVVIDKIVSDKELKDLREEYMYKNILKDFVYYKALPKISNYSKLLQYIYDFVCESDSAMCHIDYEDWKYLKEVENYTDEDLETLTKEIKELGLDEVITINDGEYKIIGWGDLETRFNDDRRLN